MKKPIFFLFIGLLFLNSCQDSKKSNTLHDELHAIFEEEWKFRTTQNNPELLPEVTPEVQQQRAAFWKGILEKLAAIDKTKLTQKDRINYDIFKYQLEDLVARIGFEDYLMPLNAEGGFYTNISYMVRGLNFEKADDYEKYLKKLAAISKYFEDNMNLMRLGVKKGITQPKVIVKNYKALIKSYLVESPEESSFYRPFKKINNNVPIDLQQNLQKRAKEVHWRQ